MASLQNASDYSVRWFEPADTDDFVSLYDDTFGGGSEEWFKWKYVDNPRVDAVPILIAEADGEFAGARAQVPFLMQAGEEPVIAMRFGDTMVHPDHRRRGVFSRLTTQALEHFSETDVEFCFNCPNDLSLPGFLKAGGETVAQLTSYYRVQNPAALARTKAGFTGVVGRLSSPAANGYLTARDFLRSSPTDFEITRHDEMPVPSLAGLYRRSHSSSLHAVRDEPFLEWRYRNPNWEYSAYTAQQNHRIDAALVTGTQTDEAGVTTTTLVDVLPIIGNAPRNRALRALLNTAIRDADSADLIAYCGRAIPHSILREYGFYDDQSFPLGGVTEPTNLVAYYVGSEHTNDWVVNTCDLHNPDDWGLSYVELDAR